MRTFPTMNEILQTTNPYLETRAAADTDTQELINNWFYDREINQVSDDLDKWLRQFRRNLDHCYDHYLLMAELELTKLPNLSSYEKAIHFELNAKHKKTGSKTGTDTHGGSLQETTRHGGTETLTRTGTDTDQGTDSNTRTYNNTDTLSKTGTDKLKRSGTDTDQGTEGNTRTFNDTDALTRGGSRTTSNSGTQTTTQTQDATHSEVALVAPQSAQYSGVGAGQMPALDWTYVSNQAQSKDNAGASQRSDNLQETMQDNTTETKKHTGTVTDQGNKSNTKTLNLQDDTTYNTTESNKHAGTVGDSGTHGNTKTLNLQDQLTKGGTDTTETRDNRSITYNTSTGEDLTKQDHSDQMETGRDVVETEIRKQIWSYIEHSFALEWLIKELDVCFLGVF